jgi:hypothetical protein
MVISLGIEEYRGHVATHRNGRHAPVFVQWVWGGGLVITPRTEGTVSIWPHAATDAGLCFHMMRVGRGLVISPRIEEIMDMWLHLITDSFLLFPYYGCREGGRC